MRALRHVPRAQGRRGRRLTAGARVVCVFPGQGAQRVGMGSALAEQWTVAQRTFDEADAALGAPLSRLCFGGPAETLDLTENAQPAILAASIAAWRVLRERCAIAPVAVAGHSLGEWSALVAAGVLSLAEALRAVRERGRLMQVAVPVGEGGMAAVLGADRATVEILCAEAAGGLVLTPANLNGGGQIVVAGHAEAIERLLLIGRERRLRVQRLAVSAPFHCPLMAPVAAALARALETVTVMEPTVPVVSTIAARAIRGAAEVRTLLVEQVTAPVRWEEAVRVLAGFAPDVALEVGPGHTLRGLMKRILPELPTLPVGDPGGVAAAEAAVA